MSKEWFARQKATIVSEEINFTPRTNDLCTINGTPILTSNNVKLKSYTQGFANLTIPDDTTVPVVFFGAFVTADSRVSVSGNNIILAAGFKGKLDIYARWEATQTSNYKMDVMISGSPASSASFYAGGDISAVSTAAIFQMPLYFPTAQVAATTISFRASAKWLGGGPNDPQLTQGIVLLSHSDLS